MQVETYEVEEMKGSEATTMAADSEAIELAEKLGLAGQMTLCNKDTATRNPYKIMSARERLVYGTLFPAHTTVERYSSGIIPLRVLQVIAYCREAMIYKRMEIWHPEDSREPDPILVGHTTDNVWDTGHQEFILARWGDCLLPFDKLTEKAKLVWMADTKQKLMEAKAKADACLEQLASKADQVFATGRDATINMSAW